MCWRRTTAFVTAYFRGLFVSCFDGSECVGEGLGDCSVFVLMAQTVLEKDSRIRHGLPQGVIRVFVDGSECVGEGQPHSSRLTSGGYSFFVLLAQNVFDKV